jgi:hypothetical protein
MKLKPPKTGSELVAYRDQLRQALEEIFKVEDACQRVIKSGNLDEAQLTGFKLAEMNSRSVCNYILSHADGMRRILELTKEYSDTLRPQEDGRLLESE